MREVASFMQMYPSYKLRDVLNEYAITFFSLLNEGYRLKYDNYLMLANIAGVSIMTDSARNSFLKQLEYAAKAPSDILKTDGETDTEAVKRMLGK